MIRLSRKGWNNVLIFSTLLMIFLFNGLHQKLFNKLDDEPEIQQNIIPPTELILTLDLPGVSVERIGRSWRTQPEQKVSAEQLQQIIHAWQGLIGLRLNPEALSQWQLNEPNRVAVFWFAGQTQGFVVQWFEQSGKVFVKTPQAWFELPEANPGQLFL